MYIASNRPRLFHICLIFVSLTNQNALWINMLNFVGLTWMSLWNKLMFLRLILKTNGQQKLLKLWTLTSLNWWLYTPQTTPTTLTVELEKCGSTVPLMAFRPPHKPSLMVSFSKNTQSLLMNGRNFLNPFTLIQINNSFIDSKFAFTQIKMIK